MLNRSYRGSIEGVQRRKESGGKHKQITECMQGGLYIIRRLRFIILHSIVYTNIMKMEGWTQLRLDAFASTCARTPE